MRRQNFKLAGRWHGAIVRLGERRSVQDMCMLGTATLSPLLAGQTAWRTIWLIANPRRSYSTGLGMSASAAPMTVGMDAYY